MPTPRAKAPDFDIRFDVRLKDRYIAEGKLTAEEVEKRCLAGPDAAGNLEVQPAPEAPAGDGPRPSRVRAAPGRGG